MAIRLSVQICSVQACPVRVCSVRVRGAGGSGGDRSAMRIRWRRAVAQPVFQSSDILNRLWQLVGGRVLCRLKGGMSARHNVVTRGAPRGNGSALAFAMRCL